MNLSYDINSFVGWLSALRWHNKYSFNGSSIFHSRKYILMSAKSQRKLVLCYAFTYSGALNWALGRNWDDFIPFREHTIINSLLMQIEYIQICRQKNIFMFPIKLNWHGYIFISLSIINAWCIIGPVWFFMSNKDSHIPRHSCNENDDVFYEL